MEETKPPKNGAGNSNGSDAGEWRKTESRALAKGLILLEYLGEKRSPMSLGELAEVAALGKASTLRILNTLEAMEWLVRDANDEYCLDREWPDTKTQSWLRRLKTAALPVTRELNADFAQTVTLAALCGDHVRVVEVLDSPQVIRMANYNGRILPPYASSLGKAIAAFQTPQKITTLLQTFGAYRFTERTMTDPRAIQKELAEVREYGFSCDNEETVIGGVCFGAAVRSADGSVAAAISISTPTQHLAADAFETLPKVLIQAARKISGALGLERSRKTLA